MVAPFSLGQMNAMSSNYCAMDFPGKIGENPKKSLAVMADDKSRSVPVSVSVSPRLYSYLGWLARNTILGTKETDVAGYLLTKELRRMLRRKEHKQLMPPDEEPIAASKEPDERR